VAADIVVAHQLALQETTLLWCMLSISFITTQFLACHLCVLRYLMRTRAGLSRATTVACVVVGLLGFPLLPICLDVLMFLEPLTALTLLRRCLPAAAADELILLLPRYRRARVLLEVLLEGIPQSTLEVFIFLRMPHPDPSSPRRGANPNPNPDRLLRSSSSSLCHPNLSPGQLGSRSSSSCVSQSHRTR
jgi:hypothetical protein